MEYGQSQREYSCVIYTLDVKTSKFPGNTVLRYQSPTTSPDQSKVTRIPIVTWHGLDPQDEYIYLNVARNSPVH
ncbi:hypothetical protein VFPPC_16793 [Pochonia chlamydosporia 170]|uniref:Uncharacterized protein n=1 Tax=Pochonia chlamydosporia 170 TaxID=1380566 RepID=A0A179F4G0_METCM|nr:hypothetical protein VFPPC_16793 [Pochonia chlamydosporia 170]OAQ60317.1 hypothetical protein VFPPC_16793 [Pochonia chlamydosporia 170]